MLFVCALDFSQGQAQVAVGCRGMGHNQLVGVGLDSGRGMFVNKV